MSACRSDSSNKGSTSDFENAEGSHQRLFGGLSDIDCGDVVCKLRACRLLRVSTEEARRSGCRRRKEGDVGGVRDDAERGTAGRSGLEREAVGRVLRVKLSKKGGGRDNCRDGRKCSGGWAWLLVLAWSGRTRSSRSASSRCEFAVTARGWELSVLGGVFPPFNQRRTGAGSCWYALDDDGEGLDRPAAVRETLVAAETAVLI